MSSITSNRRSSRERMKDTSMPIDDSAADSLSSPKAAKTARGRAKSTDSAEKSTGKGRKADMDEEADEDEGEEDVSGSEEEAEEEDEESNTTANKKKAAAGKAKGKKSAGPQKKKAKKAVGQDDDDNDDDGDGDDQEGGAARDEETAKGADDEDDEEASTSPKTKKTKKKQTFAPAGASEGGGSEKKSKQAGAGAGGSSGGLAFFRTIKSGTAALDSSAKMWVASAQRKGVDAALCDLVNLAVCCSLGGTTPAMNVVKPEESVSNFEPEEWNEVMERVMDASEELKAGSLVSETKYPIYPATTKEAAKLRSGLKEWCKGVVGHCRQGNSYNYVLLGQAVQTLGTLSSSSIPCLRHTSMVLAWAFTDTLVAAAADVLKRHTVARRQLEAERAKSSTSKKCRDLGDHVAALWDASMQVDEIINQVITVIFTNRWKDSRAYVREEAISALAPWIVTYPTRLFEDHYLKYFGWALFDKDADVRLAAVKSIRTLFCKKNELLRGDSSDKEVGKPTKKAKGGKTKKKGGGGEEGDSDLTDGSDSDEDEDREGGKQSRPQQLVPFIARFKGRLLEVCHDACHKVSSEALALLTTMLETGVLADDDVAVQDEEIDKVEALVFDAGRPVSVRSAALKFFFAKSETFSSEALAAAADNDDDGDDDEATAATDKTPGKKGNKSGDAKTPASGKKSGAAAAAAASEAGGVSAQLAARQLDELLGFAESMMFPHPASPSSLNNQTSVVACVDTLVEAMVRLPQGALLQDWAAITQRLLSDTSSSSSSAALSERHVLLLCRVFCRSAEIFCDGGSAQALSEGSGGAGDAGGVSSSPKKGSKKSNAVGGGKSSETTAALGACLIQTLPALLERFQGEGGDGGAVARMVPLVTRLNAQVINTSAHKAPFKKLLKQLQHLVLSGSTTTATTGSSKDSKPSSKKAAASAAAAQGSSGQVAVVGQVCSALRFLLRSDHSRQADVQVCVQETAEILAEKLKSLLEEDDDSDDAETSKASAKKKKKKGKSGEKASAADREFALGSTCSRLACLAKCVDLFGGEEFVNAGDSEALLPLLGAAVARRTRSLPALLADVASSVPSSNPKASSGGCGSPLSSASQASQASQASALEGSVDAAAEKAVLALGDVVGPCVELLFSATVWSTRSVMEAFYTPELDIVTVAGGSASDKEEVEEEVRLDLEAAAGGAGGSAEGGEGEEGGGGDCEADEDEAPPGLSEETEDLVLQVLTRRAVLLRTLEHVLAMHLELNSEGGSGGGSSAAAAFATSPLFDASEGLPPVVQGLVSSSSSLALGAVRQLQGKAYGCLNDLATLHKQGLLSYDRLRQLSWSPSPSLTMLSANYFHATDPRQAESSEVALLNDGEDPTTDDSDDDSGAENTPKRKKRFKSNAALDEEEEDRVAQLAPLEAHVKTLLYNPHHRSRRQASAVFDYLVDDTTTGGGRRGGGKQAAPAEKNEAGNAVAGNSSAASSRYFFDEVKAKSGVANLLEIEMTSLQLSFTNGVLALVNGDDSDDDESDDEEELELHVQSAYDDLQAHAATVSALLFSSSGGATAASGGAAAAAKAKREERARLMNSMLSFLKEGMRFALASGHPAKVGFLVAMEPFLTHLNGQKGLTEKLQEHFGILRQRLSKAVLTAAPFMGDDDEDDEEEGGEKAVDDDVPGSVRSAAATKGFELAQGFHAKLFNTKNKRSTAGGGGRGGRGGATKKKASGAGGAAANKKASSKSESRRRREGEEESEEEEDEEEGESEEEEEEESESEAEEANSNKRKAAASKVSKKNESKRASRDKEVEEDEEGGSEHGDSGDDFEEVRVASRGRSSSSGSRKKKPKSPTASAAPASPLGSPSFLDESSIASAGSRSTLAAAASPKGAGKKRTYGNSSSASLSASFNVTLSPVAKAASASAAKKKKAANSASGTTKNSVAPPVDSSDDDGKGNGGGGDNDDDGDDSDSDEDLVSLKFKPPSANKKRRTVMEMASQDY